MGRSAVTQPPIDGGYIQAALSPSRITPLGYDDFSAASDGALVGRTPNIGPNVWAGSGVGVATLRIASGYLRADSNAYAFLNVGAIPVEFEGTFRNAGAAASTTVALLLNTADLNDMVHVNFGPTAITASYWKTAVGSSQPFTWQQAPSFTSLSADTDYKARISRKGNRVTAWIEDTAGNEIGRSTFEDTVIASLLGQSVMIQCGASTSRWSKISVRSAPTRNTSDEAKFNTGFNGPVGMLKPGPGFFTNVHIGTGIAFGLFSMRMVSAGDVPTINGSNVAGNFIVQGDPLTPGFGATYTVKNSAGGNGAMGYDGSYNHYLASGGSNWLTKPNAATPYFAAGIKVNGSSGVTQTDATAKPTTGSYTIGDFVWNKSPAIAGGKVLLGWSRLTTGSGHVADTDWAALYCTNS